MVSAHTAKGKVVIAGVGMTDVGEHWDRSLRQLALEAIQQARTDASGLQPQALFVGNMLAPSLSGQTQLGALLADYAGLRGIEAMAFEAAGASGGVALRQAYLAVGSGLVDVALAVGVEKVTDQVGPRVDAALAMSADADFEGVQGMTPTAQAALLMRRYLHDSQAPADALAGFSLTAHANAVTNPHAMYRRALRPEEYVAAEMLSEPLGRYDAAPVADGAAAVLLTRAEALPDLDGRPVVRIAGSAVSINAVALHDQADPLALTAAAEACARAFEHAGLRPEDVDVFELHDLFSIYAALSLEAAGFASRGEGWRLARDGAVGLRGRIPVSTFGGSKARGDTGGATGVYQAAEATLQLQGRAGQNQVPGAKVALIQCLGGIGATACTHILTCVPAP